MRQDEISPASGSRKNRKRVGRGDGSGHGTYCGRGVKGQKSRSGFSRKRGFEGGQLPLIKRLPRKRGFTNIFRTEYSLVNVEALNRFEAGSEVTPDRLVEAGVVKSLSRPIKILARGDLGHPLSVKANRFSAAARAKIEAAGGTVEEMGHAAESS
ncbi:MAG TPA: 50S ribosomal protein L15 [Dehalococcoidia bacterium]|nr:50S ribosomal protein L15 [Dehalococcoidia bacterium]